MHLEAVKVVRGRISRIDKERRLAVWIHFTAVTVQEPLHCSMTKIFDRLREESVADWQEKCNREDMIRYT